MRSDLKQLVILFILLTIKVLCLFCLITRGEITLGPDESQYWTWSQQLDWGYYSKPPGIAWQIWCTTAFLGQTELGVRTGPLFFSVLLPFAVYGLARAAQLSPLAAFWAAATMAFAPVGWLAGLFATTDGGLVFSWTLASILLCWILRTAEQRLWWLFGLSIALGALFKWPIYYLWVAVLVLAIRCPRQRSSHMLAGFCLSLFGLLPSLYWNATHDWATFRHVAATLWVPTSAGSKGNFWDFLGAQLLLLTPVALFSAASYGRRLKHAQLPLKMIGQISLFVLVAHLFLSTGKKIQGNWAVWAYPGLCCLAGAFAEEKGERVIRWLSGGLAFFSLGTLLVCAIPSLQIYSPDSQWLLNPFRHNTGWRALEHELAELNYDPQIHYLVADTYQTTSELSFYNASQQQAYFLNMQGRRRNQFSYWPGVDKEEKREGFFIYVENIAKLDQSIDKVAQKLKLELSHYYHQIGEAHICSLYPNKEKPSKIALIIPISNLIKLPHESESF